MLIMKKLSVFCILLIIAFISCDFGNNPENNNSEPQSNHPQHVEPADPDSFAVLYAANWVCDDIRFYITVPVYDNTIRDTVSSIYFQKKDTNGVWRYFPNPNPDQGLLVLNITNSSFRTYWLGEFTGDMFTVHYKLKSLNTIGSNQVTISYPGYQEIFYLSTN